ncbi:hypothetical protein [Faucicola boevrei]|uniref:hypothetical protein n=1 Tax=Faucicola boevrei TaxID=346665 RepID=UPI000361DF05|nr:hypothetical protein [Moraxella boevrei]
MSDLENRFSNQVNLETYQAQVENLALLLNILAENVAELKQGVVDVIRMLNGF